MRSCVNMFLYRYVSKRWWLLFTPKQLRLDLWM